MIFSMRKVFMVVLLGVNLSSVLGQAIGSPGCVADASGFDARFPTMREWAKAGVEGGVKYHRKINKIITPQDNLQQAIEQLGKRGGGVLLLRNGEYVLRATVHLESGVILRGESKDSVLLSVKIHGYHFKTGKPRQSALLVRNKQGVGIENLTMKYTDANFEPLDKDSINGRWIKAIFHQKELRDTSLFVEHIWIDSSRNCWVQNCKLLWAGSDPLRITNSEHITCRMNYVDRSYNKNDGGMGYYNIINSRYVLITKEYIRRLRHFTIQVQSRYNVVYDNYLEVDINFHDDDGGYNLIEKNIIIIPTWHSWHCFQRGDPKKHRVPGPSNIIYDNNATFKTQEKEASDRRVVYVMNTQWGSTNTIPTQETPPRAGTFYSIKCR